MTDERPPTPEEEDDFLAAELALGIAEGEDRTVARERARRDSGFAARVAAWQERFVVMTDAIAPVTPRRRVRRALMSRIFPKQRVPLMQRVWVWQGLTVASLVLAAYFAMPMLRPLATDRVAAPIYAAQLSGDLDDLQVFVVLDPARQGIAFQQVAGGPPQGRVLELWAILPNQAPVSLGVLSDGMTSHVPLPPQFADVLDQVTLAISDEPPGGAPEGQPSGEIRATGSVSEI